jgi:hypothetical protein
MLTIPPPSIKTGILQGWDCFSSFYTAIFKPIILFEPVFQPAKIGSWIRNTGDAISLHAISRSTVKNAVELLDDPSRNNSLMMKKYNSYVEIPFSYTHVLFFQLSHRIRKFDIRIV